jgi:hypothetical protein
MGVQAIDQPIFLLGIGKDQSRWPRAIEHFGLSQYLGKNILIYCMHSH